MINQCNRVVRTGGDVSVVHAGGQLAEIFNSSPCRSGKPQPVQLRWMFKLKNVK
ncbi:MAG: hypothetical protein AB7G44_08340 [Bacteroidia bacterium]